MPDVPVPAITAESVYWAMQHPGAELLVIRRDNQHRPVVASLLSIPSTLDTPAETSVPTFLIDRLCVHPDHRGRRLVPAIVSACVDLAKRTPNQAHAQAQTQAHAQTQPSATPHQSLLPEPVGLFAVELDFSTPHQNRLPFSEAARVMRVYQTVSPALLLDPPAEVSYRLVTPTSKWPSKLHESSEYRRWMRPGAAVQARTLEPDVSAASWKAWWSYITRHPNHSLLSVGGSDWIHLSHQPTATSDQTPGDHVVVELTGTSFDRDRLPELPQYVYAFVRRTYASEASVRKVSLVVPQGLQTHFEKAPAAPHHARAQTQTQTQTQNQKRGRAEMEDTGHHTGNVSTTHGDGTPVGDTEIETECKTDADWAFYDAHYIYMYNYRIDRKKLILPHTFDLPIY